MAHRWRERPVAVFQFLADIGQLIFVLHACRALIHAQPLVFFGDVLSRYPQIDAQVELGADALRELFAL